MRASGQPVVAIRIWVSDGIMASGVAGPIDVFNAANQLNVRLSATAATRAPLFTWRIESLDGQSVKAASGHSIAVDGGIDSRKRADAIVVAGGGTIVRTKASAQGRSRAGSLLHRQLSAC